MVTKHILSAFSALSLLLMSGCGGGSGGDSGTPEQTYTLGGTASGLGDGAVLTLSLNGSEDVNLSGSGTFSFSTEIIDGGSYSITVEHVTSSAELPILYDCSVSPSSGTMHADVSDINVSCDQFFYFLAIDGIHGQELWKTDGTAEGTAMVKDMHVGATGSNPVNLTVMDNLLYFSASPDGHGGDELWKSDGTEAGTVMLTSVTGPASAYGSYGFGPENLTVVGDTLYLSGSLDTCGSEVFKVVDTDANVSLVRDIKPCDTYGEYEGAAYFTAVGDTLYFAIADDTSEFDENNYMYLARLWRTTDTEENATRVIDGITLWMAYGNTVLDGRLYFVADDGVNGKELWRTDAEQGAVMLKNINPSGDAAPSDFAVMGGELYFTADDGTNDGLWKTDGTTTVLIKAFDGISDLTAIGDTLYFRGKDSRNYQAWKSDGTTEGTVMFKELRPGSSAAPSGWTQVGDSVYFRGKDATGDYRLWKTVDTDENASVVASDIEVSSINYMKAVGDTLYFVADDGNGAGLWKTVNTDGNVTKVLDVDSGSAIGTPSDYEYMYAVGDTLYFWAGDSTYGVELWKTVAGGARIVKDINAGLGDSK